MNDFEKLMMKYFCLAQNQPEYPSIKYVHDDTISGRSYFLTNLYFLFSFSKLLAFCKKIVTASLNIFKQLTTNG